MSSNIDNISYSQREEPSVVSESTSGERTSAHTQYGNCPVLPPLEIEAAIFSTNQRRMSRWSVADSYLASTAVDNSVDPSIMEPDTDVGRTLLEKGYLYEEISATTTQPTGRTSPSLKPSASDGKSISAVSLPEPAIPLPVESPGQLVSMSLLRKVALVLVACSAQFLNLGGMNQTVAPVMVLADYFQIRDYGTLSWFSAAYSMTVGTFILPAGKRPVSYFSTLTRV